MSAADQSKLGQTSYAENASEEPHQRDLAASSATSSHQCGDEAPNLAHGKRAHGTTEREDGDEPSGSTSANKRQRTGATMVGKRKGRVGKLQSFQEIPMDLLVEIARHLDPHTLLNLSRASKRMRQVFASRSTAPVWQAARRNVRLPDLTAGDMTELQYAALMYDRDCHICGRGRAILVDYALRVRWCKACRKRYLMPEYKLRAELPNMHANLLDVSLYTYDSITGSNKAKRHYFCFAGIRRMDNKLHAFEAAKDWRGLWAFVEARKVVAAASVKDGATLSKWVVWAAAQKAKANQDAGLQREADVAKRLVELGYDRRDCSLARLADMVRKPGPLTDRAWQQMQPDVLRHVAENRTHRLRSEAFDRMKQARAQLEPYYKDLAYASEGPETFPSFRAFCQLPSVRPLWVPEDAIVTPELWASLQPALAGDVKKADRRLRVMYARRVLARLKTEGLDFDEGLARSLAAPAGGRVSYYHERTFSYSLTSPVDEDYRFESTEANLDDLAPDVTDAQLDDLLNRFLNQHPCGAKACRVCLPFPAIHTHMRTSCESDDYDRSVGSVLDSVFTQLDSLRRAAKLPDHISALDSLRALGPVFSCHNCTKILTDEHYATMWRRGPVQVVRPAVVPHLTLDELLAHTVQHHAKKEYVDWGSTSNQMRLETLKYDESGQPEYDESGQPEALLASAPE